MSKTTRDSRTTDQWLQVQIDALKRKIDQTTVIAGPHLGSHGAAPSVDVTLTVQPGIATTFMRSDGAPKLSQAIAPNMTGAWQWTPATTSTVPMTVNGISGQTVNMATWSPFSGLDTIVTKDGNVGVGDETPTSMVSIRSRAEDISEAAILALNPTAWWDASDVDGLQNGNLFWNTGDHINNLYDKAPGHARPLTPTNPNANPQLASGYVLKKTGGPNNKAYLDGDIPGEIGNYAPFASLGDPATWSVVCVWTINGTPLASASSTICASIGSNIMLPIPSGNFGNDINNRKPAVFFNVAGGSYRVKSTLTSGVESTPWTSTAGGFKFWNTGWDSLGQTHNGWIMGLPLDNSPGGMVDTGTAVTTSSWDQLFHTQAGANNNTKFCEVIFFAPALNSGQRAIVDSYLATKYGPSAPTPPTATPLQHWKDVNGVVDSVVDIYRNFGLGTAATTPAAKLHIISTTEQLRLGYGVSNYFKTTVGSTGSTTFDLAGTAPTFTFAKPVNITGLLAVTGAITATTTITATGTVSGSNLSATGGAAPSVQVGPSVQNGSAITFMRSDAAPKLADTAVTPGVYTNSNVTIDQQGRITLASSGMSVMTGPYKFDTTTTDSDPGAGKLRLNQNTFAAATFIYLDDLTDAGVDASVVIGTLQTGDQFVIQDQDSASNRVRYQLTAAPTHATGYWKVPVSHVLSTGSLFANNERLIAAISAGSGVAGGTVTHTGTLTNNLVILGNGGADIKPLATASLGYFLRDDSTWVNIPGGGDALVANPLSQFAATTSAQLAGVLSDETGTGLAVFNTAPNFVNPITLEDPVSAFKLSVTTDQMTASTEIWAPTGVNAYPYIVTGADFTGVTVPQYAVALWDSPNGAGPMTSNIGLVYDTTSRVLYIGDGGSGGSPGITITRFGGNTAAIYVSNVSTPIVNYTSLFSGGRHKFTGNVLAATSVVDVVGGITGTWFNHVNVTDPSGLGANATLTLGDASTFSLTRLKSFSVLKSLTLTGTDSTTMTFPATSATIARLDASQTYSEGVDQTFGTVTGTKLGTGITEKIGFWGHAPAARPAAYTPSNVSTDRVFNADATSIDELADVLGTLISDLQAIGLVG